MEECHSSLTIPYNPGQKVVYVGVLLFLLLEGLTGFAMFRPETFGFVTAILGNITNVRVLHLALLYAILGLLVMHIMMALIPQKLGVSQTHVPW